VPLVSPTQFSSRLSRYAKARSLVVDLETSGLRPYLGDHLLGVALCDADTDEPGDYFSFRHAADNLTPAQLTDLLDLITDGSRELGGHNFIRFDCPMIAIEDERYYRRLLHDDRIPKWDTIVDAMLANENERSFSLDGLGTKYLGLDAAVKHERKQALLALLKARNPKIKSVKVLMGMLATLTGAEVADYAAGDVEDTRALRRLYVPHHKEWGLESLAREMYAYARLLAKIERRGLLTDRDEANARIERCLAQQSGVLAELRAAIGLPEFNPRSVPQVCALLGSDDAEARTVRRSGHPQAENIILYKQLGKMVSTYYETLRDGVDAAGAIHPQLNLTRDPQDRGGTRSGRLSCSKPNFQNLPKRSDVWFMRVRECVLARPGMSFHANDYERQEMWVGGHYSQDDALFDAYYANIDNYVKLAERTAEPGTPMKDARQQAKIDWLAIQYGARGRKLSEMHGWPFRSVTQLEREFEKPAEKWGDPEWRVYFGQKGPKVVREFFDLCPGIKTMMDQLTARAERLGCIRLFTGRVIHFDGVMTPPFVAWNRLVQGDSGEMTRIAMQRLEPMLDHYGAGLVLQVHDEVVTEVPDEHTEAVARETKRLMEDFPNFRLRPRVETSIGKTYGNVTKLELKEAA
jgi:DNA polymerase I-like protein with 3'-5' exonuclease and polymerase domains